MNSSNFIASGYYQIMVQGCISKSWCDRLGGMEIFLSPKGTSNEETILQGKVTDQAELSGILNSLYELHHPLLSVRYLGSKPLLSIDIGST